MKLNKHKIVCLCLFASLQFSCKDANKPGDAFLVYANEAVKGNYEAFAKGFYCDDKKSSVLNDSLMHEIMLVYKQSIEDKYQGLKSIEVVKDSLYDDGNKANLRVKLLFGNGLVEETEFDMRLIQDKWMINMSL